MPLTSHDFNLRVRSPVRRRPLPPSSSAKVGPGGHGWPGPPSAAPPVPGMKAPVGGGHGGPRPVKSPLEGAGRVPGLLLSVDELEEYYTCPITQVRI